MERVPARRRGRNQTPRLGRYAVDGLCSKPQALCVPSQNGFMFDCPQRHSATMLPLGFGIVDPSFAFRVRPSVEISIGPFALIVISAIGLLQCSQACSG